ncbi:MAG: mycofactocin biosynthesis peptidyl-dipeptidase MftE, partial [Actinomycetota bacterium]
MRPGGSHSPTPHSLSEMSWTEVAAAVKSGATTVILPLGATEQHGPHLPLGTDTVRAGALADLLRERLGPGTLVAPALPFGCSDEHAGFPGLLGLEAGTLARVISDIAGRLALWGVRRLILLSAHGGNREALELALDLIRHEHPGLEVYAGDHPGTISPALLAVAHRDGISASSLGLHAGEAETSEMLYLRPALVRPKNSAPGYTGDMEAVLDRLREGGLRAVTGSGVLGDPTRADPARGARYLEAAAEELAGQVRAAHG